MHTHLEFIFTPLSELLGKAGASIACLKGGVSSYPIAEYVLQSIFLKMTGFQEQKLKCICWELASEDYGYRYKRILSGELGECSCYAEKCKVFGDVIKAIRGKDKNFDFASFCASLPVAEISSSIYEFYMRTNHVCWLERSYLQYKDFAWCSMGGNCLRSKGCGSIFGECKDCINKVQCPVRAEQRSFVSLSNLFTDAVFNFRNKCAHNILAYQCNKPPLAKLYEQADLAENYLVRFALLMMIDMVFIRLFGEWLKLIEDKMAV